jgi:hypothetical protein
MPPVALDAGAEVLPEFVTWVEAGGYATFTEWYLKVDPPADEVPPPPPVTYNDLRKIMTAPATPSHGHPLARSLLDPVNVVYNPRQTPYVRFRHALGIDLRDCRIEWQAFEHRVLVSCLHCRSAVAGAVDGEARDYAAVELITRWYTAHGPHCASLQADPTLNDNRIPVAALLEHGYHTIHPKPYLKAE